jgi:N-acetylglucosaminyl-diphospho-decaprenol L-rhamnosyltransferase
MPRTDQEATVILPSLDGTRVRAALTSLAAQSVEHETVVVDNGSPGGEVSAACDGFDFARPIRAETNLGFSRAANWGAAEANGDVLIVLNDDVVCDRGFVAALGAAVDPRRGIGMAAGVLRQGQDPSLIDSAGIELDRTLLGFDYLNGEPLAVLGDGPGDPIGPSGAASAFDREVFLNLGGYDERLFAYWEDVDLALRMRVAGYRCVLSPAAQATHAHSATLGSGSRRKNYLMGFGRGFTLRKWGVLTPARIPRVAAADLAICAGQAVLDRNLSGVTGRIRGARAVRREHRFPEALIHSWSTGPSLRRRWARRIRIRS